QSKGGDEQLIAWAQAKGLAVLVDRHSDWGNPFAEGDGGRDACCDSYAVYHKLKLSLSKRVHELRGKVLLCWCYPKRCHADHLAWLANGHSPAEKENPKHCLVPQVEYRTLLRCRSEVRELRTRIADLETERHERQMERQMEQVIENLGGGTIATIIRQWR